MQTSVRHLISVGTLLIVLMLSSNIIQAQNATFSVTGSGITTSHPCPSPRDSTTYGDVEAAISCALQGNTLELSGGPYNEAFTIDKSLLLTRIDSTLTTIDAGSVSSVITVATGVDVTLENLLITGGNATTGGASSLRWAT